MCMDSGLRRNDEIGFWGVYFVEHQNSVSIYKIYPLACPGSVREEFERAVPKDA